MPSRRLSDDERAVWRRVEDSATPLKKRAVKVQVDGSAMAAPATKKLPKVRAIPGPAAPPKSAPKTGGLDSSWDRKLARGSLEPDFTIDLHGMTLDAAWTRLSRTLDQAVSMGARTILVVTGKDRGPDVRGTPGARGRIRAKFADWIAASSHASRVIAIRPASRRHGGEGAVYLVLQRQK